MKKLVKIVGTIFVIFGTFLVLAGVTLASDVEVLQPAADIVYNENVDINGTLNVDSLRVGTAGLGGVTFFNGSVLNEGATDPFTIADDLRVDGEIWRIQKGGDPIKISDNVIPTLTNTNDFGSTTNRWKNIYGKNLNLSNNLNVSGNSKFNGSVKSSTDTSMPIAYANFDYMGNKKSGSSNISASWNNSLKHWEVTITGETYNKNDYVAMVMSNDFGYNPLIGAINGKLIINFSNYSTPGWQDGFNVIIYKP